MCYRTAVDLNILHSPCEMVSTCCFSFACTNLGGCLNPPLTKLHLEKDEIVFRNQLESDSVFVILSGILTAFFYLPSGGAGGGGKYG